MQVAVIGVGQSMRGDDAAGLEAVRLWQTRYPVTAAKSNVRVELAELPGLGLLELLEGADAAVLVDAVRSGSKAGTLRRIGLEDVNAFRADTKSAHGWGMAETLLLGRAANPAQADVLIHLIGIEAGQFHLGHGMSDAVAESLPDACAAIQKAVESLLTD